MKMVAPIISKAQRGHLENIYRHYNDASYVYPDPLAAVREFSKAEDIEVVALIASALAFGNVKTILASIKKVLDVLPDPHRDLMRLNRAQLDARLEGFRHRYVTGAEVADLLAGAKRLINLHGSLQGAFMRHISAADETVLPALSKVCAELRADSPLPKNYLITNPADGSACKRHLMLLRWMVRKDKVDLGVWRGVSPALLVVPMDTHMFRVAKEMGLCASATPNLKAALQSTAAFRSIAPDDPVKYDFALTRAGIRREKV